MITQIFSILQKTPLMLEKIIQSLGNGKKCLLTKIVETITGQEENSAFNALCSDPNILLKFQAIIVDHEKSLKAIEQKNREYAYKQAIERKGSSRLMLVTTLAGILLCITTLVYYRATLTVDIISILGSITFLFGSCLKDIFIFEYGLSDNSRFKLNHFIPSRVINSQTRRRRKLLSAK